MSTLITPTWETSYSTPEGEVVCYPPVAGDPGEATQIEAVYLRGWGGGADSIRSLTGDGYVRFRVNPKPEGVAAGFGLHPTLLQQKEEGYAQFYRPGFIKFGFLFAGINIRLIVNGEILSSPTIPYTPAQATFIEVRRSGGFIQFRINDWEHEVPNNPEEFVLRAAMYGPVDLVEDPIVGDALTLTDLDINIGFAASAEGSGSNTRVGFTTAADIAVNDEFYVLARSGKSGYTTLSATEMQFNLVDSFGTVGFTVTPLEGGQGAELELGEFTMLASDYLYTGAELTLPEFTAAGEGFGAGSFGDSFAAELLLPELVMDAISYTGGVITAELELPAFEALSSDYFYLEGDMELPEFWTYSDDAWAQDEGPIDEPIAVAGWFGAPLEIYVMIHEGLEVGPVMEVAILIDDAMYEILNLGDAADFVDVITAAIMDILALNSNTSLTQPAEAQYAINMETGAVTRYSNYRFLQYARSREHTYAARSDGVFILRRGDDNGTPIDGLIRMPILNFDRTALKRIDQVYLGISKTTGDVYVRLAGDDGVEYTYQAVPRSGAHRATPGKGMQARQWTVDLIIVDAEDLILDTVEFDLAASPRRW